MSANTRQDHVWGLTTNDGWLEARIKRSMQPAEMRATTEQTVHSWVKQFHVSADARQAFHVTLARCRSENIAAALVLMPEASWFRAITPPEGEPRLCAFLDNLAHDFGISVIDRCSGLVPGRRVFPRWPSSARGRGRPLHGAIWPRSAAPSDRISALNASDRRGYNRSG
jgi:hypothetical protein